LSKLVFFFSLVDGAVSLNDDIETTLFLVGFRVVPG